MLIFYYFSFSNVTAVLTKMTYSMHLIKRLLNVKQQKEGAHLSSPFIPIETISTKNFKFRAPFCSLGSYMNNERKFFN